MVEGGATTIPGGDAASQDTLCGTPVEVTDYPGVHVEPLQPAVEKELLSCCSCDGVGVVSPGHGLAHVNPEEPEDAVSLHCSPIDGDGGMSLFLLLPVVHNQLICFVQVVLVPRCQSSDLLSVGCLIVAGDQADDGHVVSKHDDSVGFMGGHAVMRQQGVHERCEHTALRGASVESQDGGCGGAYEHSLGQPVRKFRVQSHRTVLSLGSLSLMRSLEGTMVLNTEL